ncbi:hepcidin-1-like [Lithobates pipiens]
MKTTYLCLILILSTACQQGLCAFLQENEKDDSSVQMVNPQMENADFKESAELLVRGKRHTVLHLCTYCCKCCRYKGCGYCCRT